MSVLNCQGDQDAQTPRIQKDTLADYTKYKEFHTNQKLCKDLDQTHVVCDSIQQPEEILEGGKYSMEKDTSTTKEDDSSDEDNELGKKGKLDVYELQKLSVLRTWLIFLVFCFIFEEFALEIPSYPNLSSTTKSFIGTLLILIMIMIVLIIHSFY